MTKKEIQTLKQIYKGAIFDTWYAYYKMSATSTQGNETYYNCKLLVEIEIERILGGAKN